MNRRRHWTLAAAAAVATQRPAKMTMARAANTDHRWITCKTILDSMLAKGLFTLDLVSVYATHNRYHRFVIYGSRAAAHSK